MKRIKNWLEQATATAIEFDEQLIAQSRAGRIGRRLVQTGMFLNAVTPLLVCGIVLAVTASPALAQGPTGQIFGGNDQTLGNGVREAIKWGRNLLFLLGVGGLMWAAFNFMTEKSWTKQAIGGVFCFGFSSVAALVFSFSQGTSVNLDTDLGN